MGVRVPPFASDYCNRMRITYVLASSELNGAHKVAVQHASLLAGMGHDVTISAKGPPAEWMQRGPHYHDRESSDSLESQDLVVATGWTTVSVAQQMEVGPVAHLCREYEGDFEHLAVDHDAIREVYERPIPTFVVSPHLADRLESEFGRECVVAGPPLDPLFRPAFRLRPRKRPLIVITGNFDAPVKNVRTALQAVILLNEMGLPCSVLRISSFPPGKEEQALLKSDQYLFAISPARFARKLRRADLLLFPSRDDEGFGLPLLEAMASKVAAVGSRIPSSEIMCGDAVSLVPAEDAGRFADAAAELLDDADAWRNARESGFARAQRYSEDAIGAELRRAIDWAVATTA